VVRALRVSSLQERARIERPAAAKKISRRSFKTFKISEKEGKGIRI
jgi:hypothetical protein